MEFPALPSWWQHSQQISRSGYAQRHETFPSANVLDIQPLVAIGRVGSANPAIGGILGVVGMRPARSSSTRSVRIGRVHERALRDYPKFLLRKSKGELAKYSKPRLDAKEYAQMTRLVRIEKIKQLWKAVTAAVPPARRGGEEKRRSICEMT